MDTLDVPGEALTLALWFYAEDFDPSDARLLSKSTGTGENDHYWMLSTTGGPKLRFRLKTDGTTHTLIADSGELSLRTWTHVAATYDGVTMRLYKGGIPVGSRPKTGALSTDDLVPVWLGRNPDGSNPWEGKIDDVRIYHRALSQGEIQELATGEPDTTPPVIGNVDAAVVTDTTATITWSTDEAATSVVHYGTDPSLGSTEEDLSFRTAHSLILTGLNPETDYLYEVLSTDPSGNEAVDDNGGSFHTFTTQPPPPPNLAVSPAELNFGSNATNLTFEVWNSGSGTLDYVIDDDADCLSVSPTSGQSSGEHDTITATVDRAGLPDGEYEGEIEVQAPSISIALSILVTMCVGDCGTAMDTASRTTGVAPLAVFFDAVEPANGVVQPSDGDYASFQYEWEFGDDPNATWATNGKSKNEAIGYVAAHVFENFGTYQVKLTVTDTAGQTHDYFEVIQVGDPDVVFAGVTTRCVSTSGDFTGCPDGALQVTSSDFRSQMTWLFSTNGPARVLFKRGEAFTSTSTFTSNNLVGPYTIGAFGNGVNPVIASTQNVSTLRLHSVTDARIVDVDMVGPHAGEGVAIEPGLDTLVLRCAISHQFLAVIVYGYSADRNLFADCIFRDNSNKHFYYNYGVHVAVLGCVFDNAGSHLLRCYITRSLIAHNVFRGGPPSLHQLKFVGYRGETPPLEVVEYSIISDNQFLEPGSMSWLVTLGPQDDQQDERVARVIFERNIMEAGDTTSIAVRVSATEVTVRNNVFIGTGSSRTFTAVYVGQRGIEPPPLDTAVYNNTAYRSDNGGSNGLVFCTITSSAANTTVRNNLASAPAVPNPILLDDHGIGTVADHNLLTDFPGFTDPGVGDFTLLPSSPARESGLDQVHVREDQLGRRRPYEATTDLGALEYVP